MIAEPVPVTGEVDADAPGGEGVQAAELMLLLRLVLHDAEPTARSDVVLQRFAASELSLDSRDAEQLNAGIEALITETGAEGAANVLRLLPLPQKLTLGLRLATFFKADEILSRHQNRLSGRLSAVLAVGSEPVIR